MNISKVPWLAPTAKLAVIAIAIHIILFARNCYAFIICDWSACRVRGWIVHWCVFCACPYWGGTQELSHWVIPGKCFTYFDQFLWWFLPGHVQRNVAEFLGFFTNLLALLHNLNHIARNLFCLAYSENIFAPLGTFFLVQKTAEFEDRVHRRQSTGHSSVLIRLLSSPLLISVLFLLWQQHWLQTEHSDRPVVHQYQTTIQWRRLSFLALILKRKKSIRECVNKMCQ